MQFLYLEHTNMQNSTYIYSWALKSNVMIPLFSLIILTVFQDEWLWFLLGENVLNDQEAPVGVLKIISASLQTVVKTYWYHFTQDYKPFKIFLYIVLFLLGSYIFIPLTTSYKAVNLKITKNSEDIINSSVMITSGNCSEILQIRQRIRAQTCLNWCLKLYSQERISVYCPCSFFCFISIHHECHGTANKGAEIIWWKSEYHDNKVP